MMMAVMSVMVAPPSPNKIIIIKCSPTKTIQPTCREENGAKVQLFEEELQPDEQPPPFFIMIIIMMIIVNPRQLPPCILSYDSDNGHVDCCLLGFF